MEKYSIVYIDDSPEAALSKYLHVDFHDPNFEIECYDIVFNPQEGYESLISNPRVKAANIILIDSRLFENRTISTAKFTGEEFKLILKKFFPFIEVIVITQNESDSGIQKLSKYDHSSTKTATEYYASILPKYINEAISNIRQYKILANLVKNNDCWEDVLKEKVIGTLNGITSFDNLTKADIDQLIAAFKEIQVSLDE